MRRVTPVILAAAAFLLAGWRSNFAAGVVSAALVGFLDATFGPLGSKS